jgi:hypothetical protein
MAQHEEIKTAYEEICRAHDGISEFRAKLLALLPIASGAGIFLLLNQIRGQEACFMCKSQHFI